ncbi:MAG: DNA-binding protein [Ruminococcaceae bacterium]|nr:DNA-binding protein [Oscillospiraceae bacterium]
MFEKNLNIGYLLDFYGDVLTERRRDALDFYYNNDMSLSEVAEELGISRQGARDLIKKAEEELVFYEEKLGLAKKFADAQTHAARALELCDATGADKELKSEIQLLLKSVD